MWRNVSLSACQKHITRSFTAEEIARMQAFMLS